MYSVISILLQVFLLEREMCIFKEYAGFRTGDVWQGPRCLLQREVWGRTVQRKRWRWIWWW